MVPALALPSVADGAPPGIDGGEVRRIVVGDIAALVSTLDSAGYVPDAVAECVLDPEWLTPRAVAHDTMVTWASDVGPVVPLPMWVMFANSEGVAAMLETRGALLRKEIGVVRGAREYGVRVSGDRNVLADAVMSLDPELAALEQQAQAASPGQAYLLRRKLAVARKQSARDAVGRVASEIHAVLTDVARASAIRSRQNADGGGQPNLILDGAYLVADEQYDDFRLALTQLIQRYGASETAAQAGSMAGCDFEFTGPWPPYHFVRGNE